MSSATGTVSTYSALQGKFYIDLTGLFLRRPHYSMIVGPEGPETPLWFWRCACHQVRRGYADERAAGEAARHHQRAAQKLLRRR